MKIATLLSSRIGLSILICVAIFSRFHAQNIGMFTSVVPSAQKGYLVLPTTHDFQLLAQKGDTLANGSLLRDAPDFTAFVPIQGRSDTGFLSLNHELAGLQGGVTVFDLRFDTTTQCWQITNGSPIDFSSVGGIDKPCSGTLTPWGTVISGEESILTSDLDSNGYNDAGWLIETQPDSRAFVQKIWRAGNALHENCCIANDEKTVYWGADDQYNGFIFKYVASRKQQLTNGKLFVLVRDDSTASTGTWVQIPNTGAAQCNQTNAYSIAAGAWNFSGIEDVEIGLDGKLYFSAKFSGRIWRFKDKGPIVTDLEVFVENTLYPIETAEGIHWAEWGIGADNLAFDKAGNLWVLQDGSNSHIWMVKPDHTPAQPQISLFATTPAGSEPTGITFSPNGRFMFLSFQHPSIVNSDTVLDARGKRVVFNRGTTVVIARKEYLGTNILTHFAAPVAVTETRSFDFRLSPNPSKTGAVTLSSRAFHNGKPVIITVFSPIGAICHQSTYSVAEKQVVLDFQAPVKGAYVVRAIYDGHSATAVLLAE